MKTATTALAAAQRAEEQAAAARAEAERLATDPHAPEGRPPTPSAVEVETMVSRARGRLAEKHLDYARKAARMRRLPATLTPGSEDEISDEVSREWTSRAARWRTLERRRVALLVREHWTVAIDILAADREAQLQAEGIRIGTRHAHEEAWNRRMRELRDAERITADVIRLRLGLATEPAEIARHRRRLKANAAEWEERRRTARYEVMSREMIRGNVEAARPQPGIVDPNARGEGPRVAFEDGGTLITAGSVAGEGSAVPSGDMLEPMPSPEFDGLRRFAGEGPFHHDDL